MELLFTGAALLLHCMVLGTAFKSCASLQKLNLIPNGFFNWKSGICSSHF